MAEFEIHVGDRIRFIASSDWNRLRASRLVNGFVDGRPTVRFGGERAFVVDPGDVLRVIPAAGAMEEEPEPAVLVDDGCWPSRI